MISYVVRVLFVEYEGGYHKKEWSYTFDKEEEAWDFYADIKLNLGNKEWCKERGDSVCGDGYLCDIIGIFKREETRLDE